jgi:GNAT superfamily N-acetyltransferase
MWWRRPHAAFQRGKGAGNKRALKQLVDGGDPPGLLAYAGREPVGWCSLGPREEFVRLSTSRVLEPVDGRPVWSVVCFFVARRWRERGITVALLDAAAAHARKRGARLLEGYPVAPRAGPVPDVFAWTGLPGGFAKAGFQEVARRSPPRPIMRLSLSGTSRRSHGRRQVEPVPG